jgi:hypothetical protein
VPRNSNHEEPEQREPRNWTEWREDAHQLLEELDRSLAQARQAIYRLRPMVRPKNEQNEERAPRQERPVQFRRQRQPRQ